MGALQYRRNIVEVVIARDGDSLRIRVDGTEVERAPADLVQGMLDTILVNVAPSILEFTTPAQIETIPVIAIDVREPRWSGLEWERSIHAPGYCAKVRRSHVRPRVLDIPFTTPARVLYIGSTRPDVDFVAHAFGGNDPSGAALSMWSTLWDARETVEKLNWPTVEILHCRDLGEHLLGPLLLSTSSTEIPGSVGWIGRHATFWQTRLIVLESQEQTRPQMLRAADLITGRGGPAVWVVPSEAAWLPQLYAWLFHDRPFDWIQCELERHPGKAWLFAGAGREEALRFSAIGTELVRPRNMRQLRLAAVRADMRARQVRVERVADEVLRHTLAAQGTDMPGDSIPDHARIDIPVLLNVTRDLMTEIPLRVTPNFVLRRGERATSVADIRPSLMAMLKHGSGSIVGGSLRPARAPGSMSWRVQHELAGIRRLMPTLRFEDHEHEGMLPLARALDRLRSEVARSEVALEVAAASADDALPERHVNSGFFQSTAEGKLISVPTTVPLARDQVVHLGIQIGSHKKEFGRTIGPTALIEEVFRWTHDSLGAGLEVGVTPLDFELLGPAVQELWLPARNETDRITFPVRPRSRTTIAGVARLRFAIYYQNNVLFSFRVAALLEGHKAKNKKALLARALSVRAADVDDAAYMTRTEYSIGAQLDSLSSVPRRGLTIIANDSVGQKVATLKAYDLFTVTVDANIGPKVENVRLALKSAATEAGLYRYQPDNAGTEEVLSKTLYEIAKEGWALYSTLLPNPDDRDMLEMHLDEEDVIHAAHVDLAKVVPWSLLYDRPIDSEHNVEYENPSDPAGKTYEVKRALCKATLPAADGTIQHVVCQVDPRCPLSPAQNDPLKQQGKIHCRDSVVCPARFWGFRHKIELPVQQEQGKSKSREGGVPSLATTIKSASPTGIVAAFNRHLPLAATHEQNLRKAIGSVKRQAALHDPVFYERDQVKQALNALQADLVYFYCHAEGVTTDKDGKTIATRLNFGDLGKLDQTLTAAGLDGKRWSNSPLVFLNGCATVGFSPVAPSEFITRFVQGRKAAAVIGTEVTIWELLADAVAISFMEAFLSGVPAGEALLRTRRQLLGKYNPLGLAYSLYGSADLHLVTA